MNEDNQNLFSVCLDLNGVLDEGSEKSLTDAINITLKEIGSSRKIGVSDVLKLYGNPIEKFAEAFFPEYTDVSEIVKIINNKNKILFRRYVKPRAGAIEVIRKVQEVGGIVDVVSALNWKKDYMNDYLVHLGLDGLNVWFYSYDAWCKHVS
jgi:beta-phosphoglucomutase-like phosphatase (HAD superfamily)